MTLHRRHTLRTLTAVFAGAALPWAALAQQRRTAAPAAEPWPRRTVKLMVGFPGGSTPDMAARILAEPMARALGQPVVVENRPGASGNIAADQVAKATDDHTLGVLINGNLTSAPLLNKALPYKPERDFTLLSLLTTAPLVLVARPDLPAGTAFFQAGAVAGDKWSYGSVGIGSVGHLGMELLASRSGIRPVHVPYPGNPQVVNALIAGQIQLALIPPGLAMPQVRAGKLKAIGLSTRGRSTLVPELAPLVEAGVVGFDVDVWTALVGPARLPAAAQARLAALVPELVRDADTRQKLFNVGWQAVGSAPEALRSRVRFETATLGGIILMRNIKAE
jgi:tripartite-type tricarboxylate transporter receptor subunit TctC